MCTIKDTSELPSDFLVGYAPGQPPEMFKPGPAKLIKAGSDIILQVHYTPDGKASSDRSRIGLVFAKEPPPKRVLTLSATNGKFEIPAGDPNYRVDAEFELGLTATLYGLHEPMHGRWERFRVRREVSERRDSNAVERYYKFKWQLWYDLSEPMVLPKGAKIECTAHFDDSPNDPNAADRTEDVVCGDQSWDEMMVGFFNLVFDAAMPVKDLFPPGKQASATITESMLTTKRARLTTELLLGFVVAAAA